MPIDSVTLGITEIGNLRICRCSTTDWGGVLPKNWAPRPGDGDKGVPCGRHQAVALVRLLRPKEGAQRIVQLGKFE